LFGGLHLHPFEISAIGWIIQGGLGLFGTNLESDIGDRVLTDGTKPLFDAAPV
jgi:hypothetical protein